MPMQLIALNVGLIGLKLNSEKYNQAEVWYKIHSAQWSKGIATKVLSGMINFGFDDLNLYRIQAECTVGNIGSIKVFEKVGFKKEERGRQILPL